MHSSRTTPSRLPLSRYLVKAVPQIAIRPRAGEGDPDPKPENKPANRNELLEALAQELLGTRRANGDPMQALQISIGEAQTQRQRAERAEGKLAELQKQVPDAAAQQAIADKLAKYEALGTVEDLTKRIETGDAAIQKAAQFEKNAQLTEAATLLKLKPGALFNTLLGTVEFVIDGEGEARTAKVKADDKTLSFEDYAKTRPELTDALPALQTAAAKPGTPHVPQKPAGQQPTNQPAADLAERGRLGTEKATRSGF